MKTPLRILFPLTLAAAFVCPAREPVRTTLWTGIPRPAIHQPITPPSTGKLFEYTPPDILRPPAQGSTDASDFSVNVNMAQGRGLREPIPLPAYLQQWRPPFEFSMQKVQPDVASAVPFASWQGGMAFATGSRISLPGLMGIERGSIGAMQTMGNVTLSGAFFAEKYASFASLHTVYGMNVALDWQINDRLSLHTFGEFVPRKSLASYLNTAPGVSPAMRSFVAASNFGGYMSIDISRRFGVDVGARGMYNFATGRYEAVPIAAPYVRLNNGAKIGVDAGGIIYELLRGVSGKHSGPYNPTIGAPIPMGPPPVR